MPSTETTSLTGNKPAQVYYAQDAYPFYSYQRRQRLRQRCLLYTGVIAIFTMALIVTVSYSVSHDTIDVAPNLTSPLLTVNQTRSLKLGFAPGSGSYTLFSNPANLPNSISTDKKVNPPLIPRLTEEEVKEGLEAGRQAINERLLADAIASASPLPSPSPESRHRYAVSTCASVGALALVALAELAATKKIENSRLLLGEPSAVGIFFEGGWIPQSVCKRLQNPNCPVTKYRSYDGSCNRPMQQGASMMPFRRVLPPSYADGVDTPRRAISMAELPPAREVSLKVHKPSYSSNPQFTVMLAVFGQFLDHDITATAISQGLNGSSISCCPPTVGHPECFPVPVSSGDPVFDVARRTCMDFVRSAPAPQCKLGPRQQLNQVTAFIDGSAVYGSDVGVAKDLREFSGGRLKMQRTPDNRTLLPASTNPKDGCNRETERLRGRYCFAAGDARANENLHLTTMHLLWARQHNRIVEQLAKINPNWDDETLYEETRRIVGAQLQHITYQEFIPIVLGEQETNVRDLRPLKSGYRQWIDNPDDSSSDPTIANNFAAAAFRFAHTLLPGLMKMTNEQQGTSSYVELHRMLFNPYSLYAEGGVRSSVTSATRNVIQMTSTHVTSQLTNHLFEDPMANASVPCGLDLVSLNIQRGRDHGLPGYTKWREYCGLGAVDKFSDLEGHLDQQALQEISMLYESVYDVDLYTGALAELPTSGGIVGPTFTCLIADQFVRLQKGDRFWYEIPGQPHSFTEDQLQELRKMSLARLICDCSDGVMQTQAEVMRAISPENPMISCEDILAPSFEPWREKAPTNSILQASFTPTNWTDFKNNINSTIQDMITFINKTRSSVSLDTDWLAFKNYINNTFFNLKNELSDLHPSKVAEVPKEKSSMYPDSFILRSTVPSNVYQDWISFKNDLVKSLNGTLTTMGNDSVSAAKWITFKKNVINQFADLKDQITSVKANLAPNLTIKQEQSLINRSNNLLESTSVKDAMIPAIFDWKNFKDNIVSSLNDTITDISNNMPPPGDPAWSTYRNDIKDRFSSLYGKINDQRPSVPMEMATGRPDLSEDWLAYKAEIIKTVNHAVKRIQDSMPPPGDPAWATYRDEIIKSFSAFKSTQSPIELATLSGITENPRGINLSGKMTNQLSDLSNDWSQFRSEINDSLTEIIKDIQSKKPTTIDAESWEAFKKSSANEFAKLKDEIAKSKAEWLAEVQKSSQDSVVLQAAFKTNKDSNSFDYTNFMKPVIPPAEWVAFKKEINDTVMNLLITINGTDKVNFDEVHEMFNKSFVDLKNEITSLKDLIMKSNNSSIWDKNTIDWINFHSQLNFTVNDLVENLKNQSRTTTGNTMKILLQARNRLSNLEPPSYSTGASSEQWMQYAFRINKTVADALKSVDNLKQPMLKTGEPVLSSSDNLRPLPNWLIASSLASLFYIFSKL